ncbi:MAG: SGNH/GDSL hydrolase family protein [Lachnospiraceae bacterium]|nr:SGNH/GDSL hydrolase family protein [Lachnospiraceae bacterium]
MEKKKIITIVILFVLALIVGIGAGYTLKKVKAAADAKAQRQQEMDSMVHSYSDDEDEDDEEEESEEESEAESETEVSENTESETETSENTESETESSEATTETVAKESEPYTYVAIGNSVTCNEYPLSVENLWWSSAAMCVTKPSRDYAHRFRKYLDKKTEAEKDVSLMTIVIKNWENSCDRNYYADIVIDSLPDDAKVISIQMGENVTEYKENMAAQFEYLYSGIRNKCPDAKILLFEEILWPQEDVQEAMYAAAQNNGITIIDISEFNEKYETEYKAYQGMEVLGDDGNTYIVNDITVAAHPNDEGHKCLARLLEEAYESIAD